MTRSCTRSLTYRRSLAGRVGAAAFVRRPTSRCCRCLYIVCSACSGRGSTRSGRPASPVPLLPCPVRCCLASKHTKLATATVQLLAPPTTRRTSCLRRLRGSGLLCCGHCRRRRQPAEHRLDVRHFTSSSSSDSDASQLHTPATHGPLPIHPQANSRPFPPKVSIVTYINTHAADRIHSHNCGPTRHSTEPTVRERVQCPVCQVGHCSVGVGVA